MYPEPSIYLVKNRIKLRDFVSGLGEDISYAYDRRQILVLVNDSGKWPSMLLKPGEKVILLPIITGG